MRFATYQDAVEEAEIMRIAIRNYTFVGFSKKNVQVVNFRIVYSTVRFAALQDAVEEAEIMRTLLRNYTFVGFSKKFVQVANFWNII